jgi:hypothetical protein
VCAMRLFPVAGAFICQICRAMLKRVDNHPTKRVRHRDTKTVHAVRHIESHHGPPGNFVTTRCGLFSPLEAWLITTDDPVTCGHCQRSLRAVLKREQGAS